MHFGAHGKTAKSYTKYINFVNLFFHFHVEQEVAISSDMYLVYMKWRIYFLLRNKSILGGLFTML